MTKAISAYAEDVKQNYDHKHIVITPKFQAMKNTKILLLTNLTTRIWTIK